MKSYNSESIPRAGIWQRYKAFIADHFKAGLPGNAQNVAQWRDRLFIQIITYFLPFSFIALIPGVAMSFISGHLVIGVIDLSAFALILSVLLVRNLSLMLRKVIFLSILFSLSIALIMSLSLWGPGLLYLLMICVLTTIILPKGWGYISACANLAVCILCAMLIYDSAFSFPLQAYGLGTWIAVSSNLVFLSFVVVAVLNHAIDVLERTLANDAMLRSENLKVIRNLKHSERRLNQAQALGHLGNWELDFATGTAFWSEEACRIYGLPVDDNVQSYETWASYNHPDDVDEMMYVINEARKTFSKSGVFHRIIRKDGQVRHLYSESHYDFDEGGQLIGMYGIAQDITELKVYQEELSRSNERFELVNRAAREAILDWDIVQDVTFWGNGFTEIFGYDPSDYHNHLLSGNIHPEDRDDALGILRRTLDDATQSTLYREFRYLRADRSIAHVQIRTVLIRDKSGKAIRAVSSLMDVTDLVRKSKKLEQQNDALREIAWIQSHEIRSPLACIMGLIDMLKYKDEHGMDEKMLIYEIEKAAEKLDGVIHDIVRKTEAFEQRLDVPDNDENETSRAPAPGTSFKESGAE